MFNFDLRKKKNYKQNRCGSECKKKVFLVSTLNATVVSFSLSISVNMLILPIYLYRCSVNFSFMLFLLIKTFLCIIGEKHLKVTCLWPLLRRVDGARRINSTDAIYKYICTVFLREILEKWALKNIREVEKIFAWILWLRRTLPDNQEKQESGQNKVKIVH